MAITDINISEQLETSAPSIKYTGNEGPKSPEEQQQMMLAQLEQEYEQYKIQQIEIDPSKVLSFEEWYQSEYQAARQGVAHGGIMGVDGRKRYGWGSKLKDRFRKLIPNEVAKVAEVAAPFVAPFNPAIAGLMSGIGGFDRTGSIGKSLKSGLMNYGMGQVARGIGGAGPQWGLKGAGTGSGLGSYFTSPMSGNQLWGAQPEITGASGADKAAFMSKQPYTDPSGGAIDAGTNWSKKVAEVASTGGKGIVEEQTEKFGLDKIKGFVEGNVGKIILGTMAGTGLYTAYTQGKAGIEDLAEVARGEGMDIAGIRKEVQEAFEAGEEAWNKLKNTKYPYMGEFSTKKAEGGRIGYDDGGSTHDKLLIRVQELQDEGLDFAAAMAQAREELQARDKNAHGGRIGLYSGGQSTPSDYTMEDARKTSMQDKMGGITDTMKRADLYRQGDVGQMYLAQGGRIGYAGGTDLRNKMSKLLIKLSNGTITDEEMIELRNIESASNFSTAQGKAEGGLMDLGGMEKDYRNDGGFVPLGGEEKADDVPARLSKNEFVFTADAVRGAGGGDIDKGAEIMENIMKNLEQGGQISDETQGLSGAQEMFDVSERLSEVV